LVWGWSSRNETGGGDLILSYIPPRRSEGTIQKLREPLSWPKDKPFRILSIDGGGICGILPASILAELEQRFLDGKSVAGYFDMIAGTSTGGILALGLGGGLTSAAIRDVYVQRGGLIFPRGTWLTRRLRRFRRYVRYVYDAGILETELYRIFENRVLGESQVRLCIPSFEGRYGEPWIYKTPHHPDYKNDQHERMVRVGMATSAAPTYFKAFENDHYVMVDGGIWANNPIMNAVSDALSCFALDRRQIQILSIGCGETSFSVTRKLAFGGLISWREVIKAAMRAQSRNALGQAYLLVGKDQVMRLDSPESATPIELDDYGRACNELPPMARSLIEASGQEIARMYFHSPAEQFRPVHLAKNTDQ
jgi:patatin-like phospholipase/acyl hydrolase